MFCWINHKNSNEFSYFQESFWTRSNHCQRDGIWKKVCVSSNNNSLANSMIRSSVQTSILNSDISFNFVSLHMHLMALLSNEPTSSDKYSNGTAFSTSSFRNDVMEMHLQYNVNSLCLEMDMAHHENNVNALKLCTAKWLCVGNYTRSSGITLDRRESIFCKGKSNVSDSNFLLGNFHKISAPLSTHFCDPFG